MQAAEAAEGAEDMGGEGDVDMEWAPEAVDAEDDDDEGTLEEEEVRDIGGPQPSSRASPCLSGTAPEYLRVSSHSP